MDGTVQLHTSWCDRFHLVIGTRECSAKYPLDGHHTILRYGDVDTGGDDLIIVSEGSADFR